KVEYLDRPHIAVLRFGQVAAGIDDLDTGNIERPFSWIIDHDQDRHECLLGHVGWVGWVQAAGMPAAGSVRLTKRTSGRRGRPPGWFTMDRTGIACGTADPPANAPGNLSEGGCSRAKSLAVARGWRVAAVRPGRVPTWAPARGSADWRHR